MALLNLDWLEDRVGVPLLSFVGYEVWIGSLAHQEFAHFVLYVQRSDLSN